MKENIDEKYREKKILCGVDEVGRGPLYGDVVAAAVILPVGFDISEIDDSKKISEKKRIRLAQKIMDEAVYAIGSASSDEIDEINILNATKLAMKRAIEGLKVRPDFLLIDAVALADVEIEQESIIKGDAKSASIAAASIVAKVYRDALMVEAGKIHPEYGFESHKGYGTKQHREAILKYGILQEHRKSFLKKLVQKKEIHPIT